MKQHRNFEFQVGEYFKGLGYDVDVTQAVGDWGVDVFKWTYWRVLN